MKNKDDIMKIMPELPEVEIIKNELLRKIKGKKINSIYFNTPKMLLPNPEVFCHEVKNKIVKNIKRKAKLIIIILENKKYIIGHLKLTGRLLLRNKEDKKDKYVRIKLLFNDQTELRFSSSRKFGYLEYIPNEESIEKVFSKYGPEPLNDLTPIKFSQILKTSKKKIKELLMDQSKIAGIGNIYANDSLWKAKINPKKIAKSLNKKEVKQLLESIESILTEAIKYQGSSDQWYLHTDGTKGSYQEHFKVYGLKDRPCSDCGTKIKYEKVASRGTFWCPHCQPI